MSSPEDETAETVDVEAEPASAAPTGLTEWVQKLTDQGMPIFAQTAHQIGTVTSNLDSTASELAQTVLQDAALTARLLRIANSPMFNATGRAISTVSRAVVLLGFDEVRAICLSIAVVESMLKGPQKDRVLGEMARSFHAAVQARSFAEERGDAAPEEVFIATLLYPLGDMAFWTYSGAAGEKLEAALRRPGVSPEQAQKEVLGFSLKELTLGLTKEWKLGDLLEHALEGKQGSDPRCGNVILGHQLAQAAEKGWDNPELKPLLNRIAESLYLPVSDLTKTVHQNAEEATRTAADYGAGKAGALIPRPPSADKKPGKAGEAEQDKASPFLDPDPDLQLQILRELSQLMESRPDINSVLEMVLEGIYRGIGMDRTLFALRSPDQRFVKARYVLGHDSERLRDHFHFETSPLKANIFTQVMESNMPLWLQDPVNPKLKTLVTPGVERITEGCSFYAMPIEIQGKVIGLFYADRKTSGRPMDEEGFASFRHFCQQSNMMLTFLSSRR